jgi:hypothetical protein
MRKKGWRKTLEPGQYVLRVGRGKKIVIQYITNIRWALGITSHVKNSTKHYFLLDLDRVPYRKVLKIVSELRKKCDFVVYYRTAHGYHVITNLKVSYREFAIKALQMGADPVWVSFGLRRGYWFLELKRHKLLQVLERKGYRFMVIERAD